MRREEIDRLEKFFFGEDDGIVPRAEGLSRGSSLASPSLTDHWDKDFGFSGSKAHLLPQCEQEGAYRNQHRRCQPYE